LIPSISAFLGCLFYYFSQGGSIGTYFFMGVIFAVACAIPLIGHIYVFMGLIQLFFGVSVYKDGGILNHIGSAAIIVTILFIVIVKGYPQYVKEEAQRKSEEYMQPFQARINNLKNFQSGISNIINKQYRKKLFF